MRKPSYLTFTAVQSNSSVQISSYNGPQLSLQYNLNDTGWNTYSVGTTISLPNSGDFVRFRGINDVFSNDSGYNHFEMSGRISASGDVTSLLNGIGGDCELIGYGFYNLFYECTSLITAPKLPATTLANYCYQNMFYGCTSLTTAPELPAMTLANSCYRFMFGGCTSLTAAPALPATTLAEGCYVNIFDSCTSLTTAPELPATTLAEGCYLGMFYGCTSLTAAPALPATTLAEVCYVEMFANCVSLTTAPELPATTLAEGCYLSMFVGCTSLNYIKALFITTPSDSYTDDWVINVSSTGTFIKNSSATWNVTGDNGIPSGWTVQTAA